MHVLIVDDHPLYRRGVESLLYELDSDIRTRGAGSIAEALQTAAHEAFGLVLLDLKLPGMKGLEVLTQLRSALPAVPIVIISANDNHDDIWRAIDMGAAGYIPKDTDQAVMINALRLVLAHGVYLPPQVLKSLPSGDSGARSAPSRVSLPTLGERQIEVLQGLLQGKSNKVIARDLDIAEGTVKAHLWSIYQTLGVNSRLQAMAKAHEMGLVKHFARPER